MQRNTAPKRSFAVAKPILKWAGGKTQMLSDRHKIFDRISL